MDTGERIKKLRQYRQFSTLELSMKAQISQSYLYELESGNKSPSIDTIEKLCRALRISVSDFFSEESSIPDYVESENLPPIFSKYTKLFPTEQKIIEKLIDFMLESRRN